MEVGVLALQGCIEKHIEILKSCGVNTHKIRTAKELEAIDRLILPGGESSSMLTLLKRTEMWESLKEFCMAKPCWGICAGAILLAEKVSNPEQDSLKVIPVKAHRNFYGSQLDSFKASVNFQGLDSIDVDFIRAPKLECLSQECHVLATHNNLDVAISYRNKLLTSFHSELGSDSRLHSFFLNLR